MRVEEAFWINQYLLKVFKLMNKDLVQNKVYNYFNKRDTKTQEKCGKIAGKIEYTLLLQEQKH